MELYIHIPFCAKKCEYCSFVSYPAEENQKDEYIRALLQESEKRSSEFTEPVKTVFIGGGTPSLLSPEQLSRLILGLKKNIPFSSVSEFSIEANPGTLKEDFLKTAFGLGINRLSVGMQAFQDHLLRRLGRIHTFHDVEKTISLSLDCGFRNINLDLIFGIPGQTDDDWKTTLNAAVSLQPAHISAYGLIPEEGTNLYTLLQNRVYSLPDTDLERKMYDDAIRILRQNGYYQYEISNFAKKNLECVHNIGYWTQIPYIGLGISAASMAIVRHNHDGLTCVRRTNPCQTADYYSMVYEDNHATVETEFISPENARFETMMLALRMNQGISKKRFLELHGVSIDACYGKQLKQMREAGLMKNRNSAWSLTRRGMDIQNSILVEFMK